MGRRLAPAGDVVRAAWNEFHPERARSRSFARAACIVRLALMKKPASISKTGFGGSNRKPRPLAFGLDAVMERVG